MPRLVQPLLMRQLALQSLAMHFETITYGCSRGPLLGRIVEDESYLRVKSPFAHWRESSSIIYFFTIMIFVLCYSTPIEISFVFVEGF